MPLRAIARLIQTMLYARRFFPFYVYNILGGIEDDGKHFIGGSHTKFLFKQTCNEYLASFLRHLIQWLRVFGFKTGRHLASRIRFLIIPSEQHISPMFLLRFFFTPQSSSLHLIKVN